MADDEYPIVKYVVELRESIDLLQKGIADGKLAVPGNVASCLLRYVATGEINSGMRNCLIQYLARDVESRPAGTSSIDEPVFLPR